MSSVFTPARPRRLVDIVRVLLLVLGLACAFVRAAAVEAPARASAEARALGSAEAATGSRAAVGPLAYLRDPGGTLGPEAVARLAAAGAMTAAAHTRLNFGMTGDAIWLRLPLANRGNGPLSLLVEIDYPFLDDVEFHVREGLPAGPVRILTGDRRPFESRGFMHRNFVLPVTLPAGAATEVLIRVRSDAAVQVPLRVQTPDEFASTEQVRLLLLGAYFGIALAMMLYNLALYRALREPTYWAYVAFVPLFAMFHFFLNGFGYQYLVPFSPHLGNNGAYLFLGPALAALGQFARSFLDSRTRMPRLDRRVRVLIVLLVLTSPAALVFEGKWVPLASQALSAVGCVVAIAMGIVALRGGYEPARWYLLAFMTIFVTGMAMVLRNLGLLPWVPLTAYGTQIGAALEALFLGLALSQRVRTMYREAMAAQREALEVARRTERDLESLVAERTAEIASANARLREQIAERERVESKLRDSEERLRRLAQRDPLTGVANRHLLADRSQDLLSEARRLGRRFGVVAIDLDRFKSVNDAHGHAVGDKVLVASAQRLSACLRGTDLLARIGGDEFLVLLPDVGDRTALQVVVEKLRDAFERPIELPDGALVPRASFGGALFPDDGEDIDALVRHADLSMYGNKNTRRDARREIAPSSAPVPAPQRTPGTAAGPDDGEVQDGESMTASA